MKVPLYQDFRPLIDRITARMSSWMSKKLSFAGRLQLLHSVLYNIQIFWVGMVTPPKKVITTAEQKFNKFLRNGPDKAANNANIPWKKYLCS